MLSYDFAETCVFGKQSPGPGHCGPRGAPLLPKLRGHLAEFLRESCLAPLGILYLPTCVGFGYRYLPYGTLSGTCLIFVEKDRRMKIADYLFQTHFVSVLA